MFKQLMRTFATGLVGLTMATTVGCGTHANIAGATYAADSVDVLGAMAKAGKNVKAQQGALQLFVMPDNGPKPILDQINSAKKSLKFELYMLTYTEVSKQVCDALIAKAKAGVDVQVILEAQPYIPVDPANPKPFNVNGPAMQALIQGGVRVARSSPRFVYTHEKSMVIDHHTAVIMTMNMTNSAFTKNREYVIVDKSPSDVKEVEAIFDADWDQRPITPKDPDLVVSPNNSRAQILKLIDSAQESLSVQCEFINDPEIVDHLAKAQKGRNVRVDMMLSYQKRQADGYDPNADATKIFGAAGLPSFTFTKTVTMHAKSIIADGKAAYIGSENLTANSLDKNREMGIIITDPAVVAKLVAVHATDWKNNPPAAPASK
jgi:phosphatidylserine/phosphatidylglycerophosphate/cardiolipin synthase-like enzyme